MESSTQYNNHPSVLLLNEIEILFTQIRLVELYVKQAQATSAAEATRARERFQTELAALRAEVKEKTLALENYQTRARQADEALQTQVQELRTQLVQSQRLLESRNSAFEATQSEAGELRERVGHLEAAARQVQATAQVEVACAREAFQTERAALKTELAAKESALHLLQGSVKELEAALRAQIEALRNELAAKSELLERRAVELQNARAETAGLIRRIQQLELTGEQAAVSASEATRLRENLQAELIELRAAFEQKDSSLRHSQALVGELEESLKAQLQDLQSQLTEKQAVVETQNREIGELTARTNGLAEQILRLELSNQRAVAEAQAAAGTLEDGFRARLEALEAEASQTAELLRQRAAELQDAQFEIAARDQHIHRLELAGQNAEAARNEAGRVCETLQNELSNLQRALEQRDTSLAQQQAEFRDHGERVNAEIRDLQSQLTEKQRVVEAKDEELRHALADRAGLIERIGQSESFSHEVQAAAANEVERVRQEAGSQLAAAQTELRERELALQEQQASSAAFAASLNSQIENLKNQLAENQELLQQRERNIQTADSEAAMLRDRIAHLQSVTDELEKSAAEQAQRIRAEFQAELAAREAELKEKERGWLESQALIRQTDGRLESQIHELQSQIAERQVLIDSRTAEIVDLGRKMTAVSEKLVRAESAGQEALLAASEAELGRRALETQLAARQEELRNAQQALSNREAQSHDLQQTWSAQLDQLQSQLTEKQGLLESRNREAGELTARADDLLQQISRLERAHKQTVEEAQAAASALEAGFQARLAESHAEASENSALLQNRTTELQKAHAEIAALLQRIQGLELAGQQAETTAREATQTEENLRAELSALRAAFEQKDSTLQQNQAFARETEENLNARLRDLESRFSEERSVRESQERELQAGSTEIASLRVRIHELEAAKTAAERTASVENQGLSERYETEIANLRAAVEQRDQALDEGHVTAKALEETIRGEIRRLEVQLLEAQALLDRSGAERVENRLEISGLREQVAQLELARKQTELLAAAQAEQIRERVKAEIGALDTQLADKETALKIIESRARDSEAVLNSRLDELQAKLAEGHWLIESRGTEIGDLRQRISESLDQVSHLERAHRESEEQHRAAAANLELSLRDEIGELHKRLTEKQAVVEARDGEIRHLRSEVTDLVDRVSQAGAALREAEAKAAGEIDQIRQQSQADLAALQTETEQKLNLLHKREADVCASGQDLELEVAGLRVEVKEKHGLLQSRNDELLRVKAEMDELRERLNQLESAAKHAAEPVNGPETGVQRKKTKLDSSWEEPDRKEQVLAERQAAVNDLEQDFRAQIDGLRSELAEKQALLENPSRGFLLGEPTLSESQKDKLSRLEELVDVIKADNEQMLSSPPSRRWHFSLGRKRRWKS